MGARTSLYNLVCNKEEKEQDKGEDVDKDEGEMNKMIKIKNKTSINHRFISLC